ncbi:hypothetical protein, partial [Klebsiella pneumoniae]|uniref:hypothetical protein n=1 Tax=Klebsiella pneumoniae TaxID=573 RepID=UPI0025A1349A
MEKYIDISTEGFSIAELKNMRHDDLMGVLKLGGLYLISVALTFGLTYAQAALLAMVGQKIVYNMRTDIFNHLSKLHIGF